MQQTITQADVDPNLCCNKMSLGHSELKYDIITPGIC